jgi:hypothetical protein
MKSAKRLTRKQRAQREQIKQVLIVSPFLIFGMFVASVFTL